MREEKVPPPAHKHGIESLNTIPDAKAMCYKNSGMMKGKSGAGSRDDVISRGETDDGKVREKQRVKRQKL